MFCEYVNGLSGGVAGRVMYGKEGCGRAKEEEEEDKEIMQVVEGRGGGEGVNAMD